MTKKDDDTTKDLATTGAAPPPAAIDSETDAIRDAMMDDVGSDEMVIPVIHLFQDTGNESDTYGEHPKGTWVDALTLEAVPEGTLVMLVGLSSYKAAWWDRKSDNATGYPVAVWHPKKGEPRPEYDSDGNPIPWGDPELSAEDHIDVYLLVGEDAVIPHLYRAKKTSLRPVKRLATTEKGRAVRRAAPGVYRLEARVQQNDKGRWFVPAFVPAGEATSEDLERYRYAAQMVASGKAVVRDATPADTVPADSTGEDGIPI